MFWVAAALLILAIGRFTFGTGQPLWLDEVWTGMIASQRSFAGLARQCSLDVNAPLGYVISWLWAFPSGLSNPALRFPAAFFGSVAPLVALFSTRLTGRTARLVWCILLASWTPGLFFSQEAKCYTLVILLATANAVAFARVLRSPDTRSASIWMSISSLLILAHYVSIILIACQGVIYLIAGRQRAVRTWPAALTLAPGAVALLLHATALSHFATDGLTAVLPLGVNTMPSTLVFLLGAPLAVIGVAAWAVSGLVLGQPSRSVGATAGEAALASTLWLVPLASAAAVAICVALGAWTPVMTPRYLTPMVPGLLLGLSLMAQGFGRHWPIAPALLAAGYFGVALGYYATPSRAGELHGFQMASEALMAERPQAITFLWDDPSTRGGDPGALAQIGGFFFLRAGRPTPTTAVILKDGEDPNKVLLAQSDRKGAILWLYDLHVRGTAARRFPPAITSLDPRWHCRDFGDGAGHVLACDQYGTF